MAHIGQHELEEFEQNGYIFVPGLLNPEETTILLETAREDHYLLNSAIDVDDTAGRKTRLSLWNHPGDDVYGMVGRAERIVDRMELFLGGEVYHYHSKMMLKEPRVGGAWEWHQDYGYWYQNGCLYPYMASCLIALDQASMENGCLQVLKGSHHLGRIEHGTFGGQTGADPERVQAALERLELIYCEMEPGTGAVLPREPAARLRGQHQRAPALVDDLLLQRGSERSVQGLPPPPLHATHQGRRQCDPGGRQARKFAGAGIPRPHAGQDHARHTRRRSRPLEASGPGPEVVAVADDHCRQHQKRYPQPDEPDRA